MSSKEVKLPKINVIILLLISFILSNYKYGENVKYVVYLCMFLGMFFDLAKGLRINPGIQINRVLLLFCFSLFSILAINSLSAGELMTFLRNYFVIFLVMVFGLVQFNKYGIRYTEQFFRQFSILMNIFSFANITQIFLHKPLLIMLLTDKVNAYQTWAYGTSNFRTISVFGHPIVCGLFFSLMFICNSYILKSKFKYILQIVAIINIYSTLSRSAWIALTLVLLLYIIKNGTLLKIFNYKFRLTYKKVYTGCFIVCLMTIFMIFVALNYNEISATVSERFGDSLSNKSTDVSNLQRTGTIDLITNKMLNSDPFHLFMGYGLGTAGYFMENHTVVIRGFTTTDNMYLTLFYEVGIFSLIGYGLFLLISFYRLLFYKVNKLYEMAALCFIFITVEMIFFEGLVWGIVSTFWSFILLILCTTFKERKNTIKEQTLTKNLDNVS